MREIKFRAFDPVNKKMVFADLCETDEIENWITWDYPIDSPKNSGIPFDVMQYTGLNDKNGKEIFEGDVLQFSDKYEWYRSPVQTKSEIELILNDHVKYPYERRVIEIPECYEWLLSSEIQSHWEVIGNVYENPELIETANESDT